MILVMRIGGMASSHIRIIIIILLLLFLICFKAKDDGGLIKIILQDYFDVKITKRNIEHYRNKGYLCNLKDIISVRNCDLTSGTHIEEQRKCDGEGCNQIITKKHWAFIETYNNFGKDLCFECSKKERLKKMQETNLKRYGVEHPMMLPETRQKAKKLVQSDMDMIVIFKTRSFQKRVLI